MAPAEHGFTKGHEVRDRVISIADELERYITRNWVSQSSGFLFHLNGVQVLTLQAVNSRQAKDVYKSRTYLMQIRRDQSLIIFGLVRNHIHIDNNNNILQPRTRRSLTVASA